jgi:hypothetical protein
MHWLQDLNWGNGKIWGSGVVPRNNRFLKDKSDGYEIILHSSNHQIIKSSNHQIIKSSNHQVNMYA